ncbi:hypothetical protein VTI74DRAFT_10616 [Chaetomium olivicolor]
MGNVERAGWDHPSYCFMRHPRPGDGSAWRRVTGAMELARGQAYQGPDRYPKTQSLSVFLPAFSKADEILSWPSPSPATPVVFIAFYDDTRAFPKKFRTSRGIAGVDLHHWNSPQGQADLDEMTVAYLDEHGNSSQWWPDDERSPYYNSYQYSRDATLIKPLVKQLFFRLNLQRFHNQKYKGNGREKETAINEKGHLARTIIDVDSIEVRPFIAPTPRRGDGATSYAPTLRSNRCLLLTKPARSYELAPAGTASPGVVFPSVLNVSTAKNVSAGAMSSRILPRDYRECLPESGQSKPPVHYPKASATLAAADKPGSDAGRTKPSIIFFCRVVWPREPKNIITRWQQTGRFLDKTMAELFRELGFDQVESRSLTFTIESPEVEVMDHIAHDDEEGFASLKRCVTKEINKWLGRAQHSDELAPTLVLDVLIEQTSEENRPSLGIAKRR